MVVLWIQGLLSGASPRVTKDGNNAGYANTWLVADIGKNEIGRLELGLKNVTLERTTPGISSARIFRSTRNSSAKRPTSILTTQAKISVARHIRWDQLMAENKGKIDVAAAQGFLADHYHPIEKKEDFDERTLDGRRAHRSFARGSSGWVGPYGMAGAVQNKAADAAMITEMTFTAAASHACSKNFKASEHLGAHPEYDWQKPLQRDMNAHIPGPGLVSQSRTRVDASPTLRMTIKIRTTPLPPAAALSDRTPK